MKIIAAEHPRLKTARPLVVWHTRSPGLESFCKRRHIAFEVVEGSPERVFTKVRELASRGNHTSVILSTSLPTMKWIRVIGTQGHIHRIGSSDLPYMLSQQGELALPTGRLSDDIEIAIKQLNQFFQPIEIPQVPKVTLFYGMIRTSDIRTKNIIEEGLWTPAQAHDFIHGIVDRLKHLLSAGGDDHSVVVLAENVVREDRKEITQVLLLYGLARAIASLPDNLDIVCLRDFPEGVDPKYKRAREHITNSSVILSVDTQFLSDLTTVEDAVAPFHGAAGLLAQQDGTTVLSAEHIRNINFNASPFLWLGGCSLASVEFATAVMHSGGKLIANTNFSYPAFCASSESVYTNTDLIMLDLLASNPTIGLTHLEILDLIIRVDAKWSESVGRVMNNERIILDEDGEVNGPLTFLLNRTQLWGNPEMPSVLYFANQQ